MASSAGPPGRGSTSAVVEDLDEQALPEFEQAGRLAHGEYTTAAYALRDKVRGRRAAAATAADPGASEQDAPAAAAIDDATPGEEPDVDVDAATEPPSGAA